MGVQMRIIFLFIVIISSATGEVKNLTGTEGGSITLPDPVVELGFVLFGLKPIAMVTERKIQILEEIYKDRVLWNNYTGLVTITGLQRSDSGIYTVDSKKGKVFTTSYKLTVYESAPTPAVSTLNVSAESCTFLCSVEKSNETTLLWYKDEEVVNQSSSALSLPLTVHKQDFSSTYRCVAANPAENKTHPVNDTSCSGQQQETFSSGERFYVISIIIPVVAVVIIILLALFFKRRWRKTTQAQEPVNIESDVNYTEVCISDNRCNQGGNIPDSSGPVDRTNLSTVYDKLEAHRMLANYTDTPDHVSDQTYMNTE